MNKVKIMKYLHAFIMATLLALTFSQPVAAGVYKCKNDSGKTEYSDKPCKNGKNEKLAIKKAPQNPNKVDIYITSWCGYCKKAMAYLKKNKIPFKKYDIEKNIAAKHKKQKLAPSYSGVPLTVINGTLIKGFSPESFDEALIK